MDNCWLEKKERFGGLEASDWADRLTIIPEIAAALTGTVITVQTVVLQLSASKAPANMTDLFFSDTRCMVISASNPALAQRMVQVVPELLTITLLHSIWCAMSAQNDYIACASILLLTVLVTTCVMAMLPYFRSGSAQRSATCLPIPLAYRYTFKFISPDGQVGLLSAETTNIFLMKCVGTDSIPAV